MGECSGFVLFSPELHWLGGGASHTEVGQRHRFGALACLSVFLYFLFLLCSCSVLAGFFFFFYYGLCRLELIYCGRKKYVRFEWVGVFHGGSVLDWRFPVLLFPPVTSCAASRLSQTSVSLRSDPRSLTSLFLISAEWWMRGWWNVMHLVICFIPLMFIDLYREDKYPPDARGTRK